MTLKSSADVGFILVGGRDVMGRVTVFSDVDEALLEETTALGSTTDSWAAVGQTKWMLSQEGFYEPGVGSVLSALELEGARVLMFGLTGNTIGETFLGASAIRTKVERSPSKGALHKLKAAFVADGGPDRGWVAADLVARTTTGPTATTTLDCGTTYANQTTGKMVAYLSVPVLELDGGTGLQVVVRDSDDGVTFADSITFTTVSAALSSERKELEAADAVGNDIERYIQVRHTFTGSPGASKSATFAVGVARPLT